MIALSAMYVLDNLTDSLAPGREPTNNCLHTLNLKTKIDSESRIKVPEPSFHIRIWHFTKLMFGGKNVCFGHIINKMK